MTVGERIKQRRKALGLSVDELATKVSKDRATIYRYESNEIENMPVTLLGPLAKALDITPAELMGWENSYTALMLKRARDERVIERLLSLPEDEPMISTDNTETYTAAENQLISNFRKLNSSGKEKASDYVEDLTTIDKYTAADEIQSKLG